jgi:hypothetical protein
MRLLGAAAILAIITFAIGYRGGAVQSRSICGALRVDCITGEVIHSENLSLSESQIVNLTSDLAGRMSASVTHLSGDVPLSAMTGYVTQAQFAACKCGVAGAGGSGGIHTGGTSAIGGAGGRGGAGGTSGRGGAGGAPVSGGTSGRAIDAGRG